MLTRYILHTDLGSHVLNSDELRNWDEITCSYKRNDLEGVVRSFTSSFEFVEGMYALLQYIYQKDGINAEANIEIQTQTERWEWETRFTSPLDFSTITWGDGVLSLNCIDNSLSSIIKSKKSTKYELVVGKDIKSFKSLRYDRMHMAEQAVYEFTQGQNLSDTKDIIVTFSDEELPWIGLISSEIAINGLVYFQDDQTNEKDSYLIMAHRDVKITFKWSCSYRADKTVGGVYLRLVVRHPDNSEKEYPISYISKINKIKLDVSSFEELPQLISNGNRYAVINDTVWIEGYHFWEDTGKSESDYFTSVISGSVEIELNEKDTVSLVSKNADGFDKTMIRFIDSSFEFDWNARGSEYFIPAIKPAEVARKLLSEMTDGKQKFGVFISEYDPRLANTYILAAESIRNIPNAKFYSSFSEFCDWMSTVFGYVYYIGSIKERKYNGIAGFNREVSNYYPLQSFCPHEVPSEQIYFDSRTQRFFCFYDNYYARWIGDGEYFNGDGSPRSDIVYKDSDGNAWIYEDEMKLFDLNDYVGEDVSQSVNFIHRSELFGSNINGERIIENVQDLKYSLETSLIYSAVEIGYDKKDYQETNGRDEFNFSNTYTTGCTVSDKTLKLISKYRADSYGIEYAAKDSGKDSTDTTSDNDVFFILCSASEDNRGIVYPDRSNKILGVLSDTVFNSAFSPMACVRANAGYIGLQTKGMELRFTSSTGNSDVIINGEPLSGNIILENDLATCGVIEFETDDLSVPQDNELIEVVDNGIKYRGFLKEVDFRFAKEEGVRYKLIVKDFE